MYNWILSVFGAVLIVTVIFIVLPEGRLSKFVKPFASITVLLIILSPIVNSDGFYEEISFENYSAIETDVEFLDYITLSKIDNYTANCNKIAEKNGINGSDILIQYNQDETGKIKINSVKVNLKYAVISSENEHIVIMKNLKKDLSAYLGISENEVLIYE